MKLISDEESSVVSQGAIRGAEMASLFGKRLFEGGYTVLHVEREIAEAVQNVIIKLAKEVSHETRKY